MKKINLTDISLVRFHLTILLIDNRHDFVSNLVFEDDYSGVRFFDLNGRYLAVHYYRRSARREQLSRKTVGKGLPPVFTATFVIRDRC